MKKLVAAILLALTLNGAEAAPQTPTEIAWKRAMKLAKIPTKEWATWTKPHVDIVYTPRYIPISRSEGDRLCGVTEPMFEGPSPNQMSLVFYIRVFVRPTEDDLLLDVLTHEFLHVVWVERAMYDDDWHMAHPDSEVWVRNLLPNTCPPF